MAVDDELRDRATECIKTNFLDVLETREFHLLPSIKLELIGKMILRIFVRLFQLDYLVNNVQHMSELILYWILQRMQRDHQTIQELSEYVGESTRSTFERRTFLDTSFVSK